MKESAMNGGATHVRNGIGSVRPFIYNVWYLATYTGTAAT